MKYWMPSFIINWQFFRVSFFKVALMAFTGPFLYYLDMIVDGIVLHEVIVALGGFQLIVDNITSFPATVSLHLSTINCFVAFHKQWSLKILNIYLCSGVNC